MMPDCAKKETHEKIRQGAGGFTRAGSCLRRAGHTYVSLGLHLVQQAGSVVVALEQSKAGALVRGLVEEIPVMQKRRVGDLWLGSGAMAGGRKLQRGGALPTAAETYFSSVGETLKMEEGWFLVRASPPTDEGDYMSRVLSVFYRLSVLTRKG